MERLAARRVASGLRAPKSLACSSTARGTFELTGAGGTPMKPGRLRSELGPSRYACSPSRPRMSRPSLSLATGAERQRSGGRQRLLAIAVTVKSRT